MQKNSLKTENAKSREMVWKKLNTKIWLMWQEIDRASLEVFGYIY